MLRLIQENAQRIVIHDSAINNRLWALLFSLAGVAVAYYAYSQLPDGIGFITGILIALLGIILFLTKRAYRIVFDKDSGMVSITAATLLGRKKVAARPLSEITEVAMQLIFDMFTAPSWLLYLPIRGAEDTISLNENHSALFKLSSTFKRSEVIGKKVAAFLNISYHQKRAFEA